MKIWGVYTKTCKRLRNFLFPKYTYSHIFYLILQQENQDLANATYQGCLPEPSGAKRNSFQKATAQDWDST